MDNNGKICAFAGTCFNGSYNCIAIKVKKCDGYNTRCSFYKTQAQHINDTDRAIERCRKNGICATCKYKTGKPCETSYERRC